MDDLPDEVVFYVIEARGGCRCQHPNAAPPCSVCTDPIEAWELEMAQDHFAAKAQALEDAELAQIVADARAEW